MGTGLLTGTFAELGSGSFLDPIPCPNFSRSSMLNDKDVLEAVGKGSFWLKLTKLRALGFIEGRIPIKIRLTDDGKEELKRLQEEASNKPPV